MKAVNIEWDTDDTELKEQLPAQMEIPAHISKNEISDWLSDQTGFCHNGFELMD